MDELISTLRDMGASLRPVDLLDIGIVAGLIYLVLVWLTTRASRALLVGVMTVVALYLLSRTLDLYLTLAFFRVGLVVIVLALILIFQEDIRDAFERVIAWRHAPSEQRKSPAAETIDTLIGTVTVLAEQKIGALIVLKGRDYLSRYLQIGFRLNGAVSAPLLRSIFDPHSPGHDGAVVIDGDELRAFGVHLPLSKNLAQVGPGGTRHLAALGLAERSDAMVLVVSEERGTVSVAQAGQIDTIAAPDELRRRLTSFYDQLGPTKWRSAWKYLLTRNLVIALSSLAVALLLWLMLAYRVEPVQQTHVVPIEYRNIPQHLAIDGDEPTTVRVTLFGPERAFDVIDPARLRVAVDLTDIEEGTHVFPLSEANLRRRRGFPFPDDLSVGELEPRAVQFEAFRLESIELPVRAWPVGELPQNRRLVEIAVRPTTVTLRIRSTEVDQVEEVYTEPIRLRRIRTTQTIRANLILPRHTLLAEGEPTAVQVTVTVVEADAAPEQQAAASRQPFLN